MQLRVAAPSICTVQAPQRPLPQPNFVPVSCSSSRRYHKSGSSGSPVKVRLTPLTVQAIFFMESPEVQIFTVVAPDEQRISDCSHISCSLCLRDTCPFYPIFTISLSATG